MKYPVALLVPVLMIVDYAATVLGATKAEQGYNSHFRTDHYELNPVWQEAIARRQWFNVRHLASTALLTAAIIFFSELYANPSWLVKGVLGAAIVGYAMIVGRHLSNILIFDFVRRHPERLTGEITMDYVFSLAVSAFQYLVALLPVALIAALTRDSFAIGGTIGILGLLAYHIAWIRKARTGESATDSTPADESDESAV